MGSYIIPMFPNNCNGFNNCGNIKQIESRILETEKDIIQIKTQLRHVIYKLIEGSEIEKKYCELINNIDVQKIVGWYYQFSLGKLDNLIDELNIEEYKRLSKVLYELKENNNHDNNNIDKKLSCYEKFRINIVRSLEALMKAIDLYKIIKGLKLEILRDLIYKEVYFDIAKLIQRLNELRKTAKGFFNNITLELPLLEIKPEYDIYIKKYGYPCGGIFESDKLAEILMFLNNEKSGLDFHFDCDFDVNVNVDVGNNIKTIEDINVDLDVT